MAQDLSLLIRNEAKKLRKLGFSLGEISKKLKIAKSTVSIWTNSVEISQKEKEILENKRKLARIKGLNTITLNREHKKRLLNERVRVLFTQLGTINSNLCKIFIALLYWGEGSKTGYSFAFTNSDPAMIKTLLSLLRKSFLLDESKFRALIHLHEYHNENKIKLYWSEITDIPLSQFSNSYLKPHTKRVVRPGYKGAIRIVKLLMNSKPFIIRYLYI